MTNPPALRHRIRSGMTVHNLMKQSGLGSQELRLLELGDKDPTPEQADALARAFKVPVWHFTEGCDCGK